MPFHRRRQLLRLAEAVAAEAVVAAGEVAPEVQEPVLVQRRAPRRRAGPHQEVADVAHPPAVRERGLLPEALHLPPEALRLAAVAAAAADVAAVAAAAERLRLLLRRFPSWIFVWPAAWIWRPGVA